MTVPKLWIGCKSVKSGADDENMALACASKLSFAYEGRHENGLRNED